MKGGQELRVRVEAPGTAWESWEMAAEFYVAPDATGKEVLLQALEMAVDAAAAMYETESVS